MTRLPRTLARTVATLTRLFPLPPGRTLVVRVVKRVPGATYADAFVEGKQARIRLRRERSVLLMKHTLIHEYAHIWAWSWYSDHPDVWGVAYARCYRTLIDGVRVRRPYAADVARAVERLERRTA